MPLLLNAANVIASIAGAVVAETATAGAGAAIPAALSLSEGLRRLAGKAPAILSSIAADLQAKFAAHHLTEPQKTLIPQMIERAPFTPAKVPGKDDGRRPTSSDRSAGGVCQGRGGPRHRVGRQHPRRNQQMRDAVGRASARLPPSHAAIRPLMVNAASAHKPSAQRVHGGCTHVTL
jgi:hypothetical protein